MSSKSIPRRRPDAGLSPSPAAAVRPDDLKSTLDSVTQVPTALGEREIDRLWQRLLYEGTQHTNRFNFYLVSQSMFFAAFASNQRVSGMFSMVCVSAGILMSIVWMQMARDQDVIVRKVRALIHSNCADYRAITDVNRKRRVTQRMLSVTVPLLMCGLWLIVGLADLVQRLPHS